MIYINEFASISALGSNSDEITYNLSHPNQILLTKRNDLLLNQKESYFGQVKASLPSLEAYPKHKTRNNALLAYLCQVLKEKVDYLGYYFSPSLWGKIRNHCIRKKTRRYGCRNV